MWGDDMKIGVIQASSQIEKNTILYECTKDYGEVINFGCFEDEENYSYVEIALEAVPLEIMKDYTLTRTKIIFEKETKYGDVVTILTEVKEEKDNETGGCLSCQ